MCPVASTHCRLVPISRDEVIRLLNVYLKNWKVSDDIAIGTATNADALSESTI